MSGADFVTAFPAREVRFAGRNAAIARSTRKLLDEITALSRELKLTGFNRADVISAVNKAYDENIIENNQTEEK